MYILKQLFFSISVNSGRIFQRIIVNYLFMLVAVPPVFFQMAATKEQRKNV